MALVPHKAKPVQPASRFRATLSAVNRIEVWAVTIVALLAIEFGVLLRLVSQLPS